MPTCNCTEQRWVLMRYRASAPPFSSVFGHKWVKVEEVFPEADLEMCWGALLYRQPEITFVGEDPNV